MHWNTRLLTLKSAQRRQRGTPSKAVYVEYQMNVLNSVFARAGLPELLTTAEFAAAQRCAAQTVRKNVCTKGHHHGVRPLKQPSGRLLWRASDLAKLLNGEA